MDKKKRWKSLIIFGLILSAINPMKLKAETNLKVKNKNYTDRQQTFLEINKPGWIQDDYNWYYYKSSRGRRGWVRVGETWYHKNNQGVMQAEWEKVSRKDYYPNDQAELKIEEPNKTKEDSDDFDINKFNIFEFNTEFLNLVNEERRSFGLRPLSYHFNLQKGVNTRAIEMRDAGWISHTRPNGEKFSTVFNYLRFHSLLFYLGENIAFRPLDVELIKRVNKGETSFEKSLAKSFYNQYYTSTGHYENMIEKNFTGFSVGLQEVNGRLYNVMIFSG